MEVFKCVIIEDQLPAQRILQRYIKEMPNLELKGTFINPLDALPLLETPIDVLFLDVHLPKLSGIDFLKSIPKPPHIILTTAFSEYALEGFELDVVDYLLKPFSFERFLKAVNKIKRIEQSEQPIIHQHVLFVKSKGVIQKVSTTQISYIEAKGDFVLIHTKEKRYTANSSLQNILQKLEGRFIKCHKSFVVNIDKIDRIVGNQIKLERASVPIGRTHKEALMERLEMI